MSPLLELVAPPPPAEDGVADGETPSHKPRRKATKRQSGGATAAAGPSHDDIQAAVSTTVTRVSVAAHAH